MSNCPRCRADPHPANFGSPRNCAFTADGLFTPDNWNCATIDALFNAAGDSAVRLYGNDESMDAIPALVDCDEMADENDPNEDPICGGFLILSRYKHRGCTSSAVRVGDFFPPQPVTLALVERVIAAHLSQLPEAREAKSLPSASTLPEGKPK